MSYINDSSLKLYIDAKDYPNSSTSSVWKDNSGNNNNAALYNFNYNSSSGWQDAYLQTDCVDDHFEIANLTGFNNSSFTFEVQFSLLNVGAIFNEIFLMKNGSNVVVSLERAGGVLNVGSMEASSQKLNFTFGTMFHVIQFRSDGVTYQVFLDGVLVIDRTRTYNYTPTSMYCSSWGENGGYINAQYKFIRIYNRKLSDSEIAQNYNDAIGKGVINVDIKSSNVSNIVQGCKPTVSVSAKSSVNINTISSTNGIKGNNSIISIKNISQSTDANILIQGEYASNDNQMPTNVPSYAAKSIIARGSGTQAYASGQIILPSNSNSVLPAIDFSASIGLNLANRKIEINEAFLISNNSNNAPFVGYIDFYNVSNPSVTVPLADYSAFVPTNSALINNFVNTFESMSITRKYGTGSNLTMQMDVSRKCTLDQYGKLYYALVVENSQYTPASGETLVLLVKFFLLN